MAHRIYSGWSYEDLVTPQPSRHGTVTPHTQFWADQRTQVVLGFSPHRTEL